MKTEQENFAEMIKKRDANIQEIVNKLKNHSPHFIEYISCLITSLERKG